MRTKPTLTKPTVLYAQLRSHCPLHGLQIEDLQALQTRRVCTQGTQPVALLSVVSLQNRFTLSL